MQTHTLSRYDKSLDELNAKILGMFKLSKRNIKSACQALLSADLEQAEQVSGHDEAVNALEVQADELARQLIVTHQPAASDLRRIFASIKIVTDLERISDLAVNIAGEVSRLGGKPVTECCQIETLRDLVLKQLKSVRHALFDGDVVAARKVIEGDAQLDEAYRAAQRLLLTHMMESPTLITRYMTLANIVKELERIGDHVTNIAEMTIYMVLGHEVRHIAPQRIQELLEGQDDD